jgi:activator of 2-hydroxyglutaryl-CoA dehydratase
MKLGIDVGSTTVKLVVLNDEDQIIYSKYERHMSDVFDKVQELIIQMKEEMGDLTLRPVITGSGGLALANLMNVHF